ncbi:hypothetical protein HpNP56_09130 [Helicobacter pylori]
MQEISTYKLIKEKLQAIPPSQKGSLFEKVSRRFLIEHDSANEYESIDLWSDWELRGNEGDRGIDMVVTTTSKELKKGFLQNTAKTPHLEVWGKPHETRSFTASTWRANFLKIRGW